MSAKFIIIGRWITLAEARAMYSTEAPLPGEPIGFLRGASFYEHKPILKPPPISYGPEFNRGKRKIKKW